MLEHVDFPIVFQVIVFEIPATLFINSKIGAGLTLDVFTDTELIN